MPQHPRISQNHVRHNRNDYCYRDVAAVRRFLHEAEMRSMESDVKKGVALVQNLICAPKVAAEAVGIHYSKLRRAIAATENFRPIGKTGHPNVLNQQEEEALLAFVKSHWAAGYRPTLDELVDKVFFSSFFLFFLSLRFSLSHKSLVYYFFSLMFI